MKPSFGVIVIMRSWWKHNKKLRNAGELKAERVELFKQLLELGGGSINT